MSRPYSVRFLHAGGAGTTVAYQVPAGKRALVRGVSATQTQSTAVSVWVAVAGHYVFYRDIPGVNGGVSEDVRLVAYAGEYIQLATYGQVVRAHVAGFLFEEGGLVRELEREYAPGILAPDPLPRELFVS